MALRLALACLAMPAAAQIARVPVAFEPTQAVLVLIPGSAASEALSGQSLPGIDGKSTAESELLRDCANGETQVARASRGFVWDLAVRAWRILLHPLSVTVRDELRKYSAVSDAVAGADYYRAVDPAERAPSLESRISCLRFTRFNSADPQAREVALDFVASVRLDAARDAIRLRPLRLYINQAGARSADGHYAVAIAVRADAVWRDEFAGHSGRIFERTLVTERVDLKSGSFLKYYPTDPGSGVRVPIVPLSFGVDRQRDYGRADFGVSVAELGTPPRTLTALADMLPDPDERLGQLLIAAALAAAGAAR